MLNQKSKSRHRLFTGMTILAIAILRPIVASAQTNLDFSDGLTDWNVFIYGDSGQAGSVSVVDGQALILDLDQA